MEIYKQGLKPYALTRALGRHEQRHKVLPRLNEEKSLTPKRGKKEEQLATLKHLFIPKCCFSTL